MIIDFPRRNSILWKLSPKSRWKNLNKLTKVSPEFGIHDFLISRWGITEWEIFFDSSPYDFCWRFIWSVQLVKYLLFIRIQYWALLFYSSFSQNMELENLGHLKPKTVTCTESIAFSHNWSCSKTCILAFFDSYLWMCILNSWK